MHLEVNPGTNAERHLARIYVAGQERKYELVQILGAPSDYQLVARTLASLCCSALCAFPRADAESPISRGDPISPCMPRFERKHVFVHGRDSKACTPRRTLLDCTIVLLPTLGPEGQRGTSGCRPELVNQQNWPASIGWWGCWLCA